MPRERPWLGEDGDGEDGRDPSVAAVLLDTLADAAAAAGVAATGAIILATGGWYWLDPAVALTIAIVVGYHAFALIRKFSAGSGPRRRVALAEARCPLRDPAKCPIWYGCEIGPICGSCVGR